MAMLSAAARAAGDYCTKLELFLSEAVQAHHFGAFAWLGRFFVYWRDHRRGRRFHCLAAGGSICDRVGRFKLQAKLN
jgi:hypothetical protein